MSVSTNQLFHFTSKSNILSILANNFIPFYSLEKIFSDELILAIPMVSFCDIPLTQTSQHIKEYKNYGIGLSKKWGISNKLNPIFYYTINSELNRGMKAFIKATFTQAAINKGFKQEDIPKIKSLLYYIYYSKPYRGSNWDKKLKEFKKNKRCLYNEREWRFIPDESSDQKVNFLFKDDFLNDRKMTTLNRNLEKKKLIFSPDDISYIILRNNNEIIELVDTLNAVKGRYSEDQQKILISKIITKKQIMHDF